MKIGFNSNLFVLCAAAMLVGSASGAETISGAFNTSLGYLAGHGAQGNRMTVMGAGSGGESYSDDYVELFGGACGTFSSYLIDVTGIGYRSVRYSSNMSNVVAIGSFSLSDISQLHDATYLNGQFYAEKDYGLYLTNDKDLKRERAPIFFTNGVWTMNANLVIKGQVEIASEQPLIPIDISGMYDLYLDSEKGDDANTGYVNRPKRTMKAILDKIAETDFDTNYYVTVCVYPGQYEYPMDLDSNVGIVFDAIGGSDKTFIGEPFGVSASTNRYVNNRSPYWIAYNGFTFRDFDAGLEEGGPAGAFCYVWFGGCEFTDAQPRISRNRSVFHGCVLDKGCVLGSTVIPMRNGDFSGLELNEHNVIIGSEIYDSIISFGNGADDDRNTAPRLSHRSRFVNSFVLFGICYGAVTYPASDDELTILGQDPTVIETTVIVHSTNQNHFKDVIGTYERKQPAKNCLIAINQVDEADVYGESNKAVSSDVLKFVTGSYRPLDSQYWYWGYDSAKTRNIRNSVLADVAIALDQEGYSEIAEDLNSRINPDHEITRPVLRHGMRHGVIELE